MDKLMEGTDCVYLGIVVRYILINIDIVNTYLHNYCPVNVTTQIHQFMIE